MISHEPERYAYLSCTGFVLARVLLLFSYEPRTEYEIGMSQILPGLFPGKRATFSFSNYTFSP